MLRFVRKEVFKINIYLNKRSQYRLFSNVQKKSHVAEFYAGQSVFITGGTGFIGKIEMVNKHMALEMVSDYRRLWTSATPGHYEHVTDPVLIEKLLYSCKGINKVYVLVRDKEGVNANERISDILKLPIFDRLKRDSPDELNKIVPVSGDISENNLALSDFDQKFLEDNVSIVFHVAASVNFNEPLDTALNNNTVATDEVVRVVHRLKKLKSFVYFSTVYANTDQKVGEEVIYPPPATLQHALEMAKIYSKDKDIVKHIIGKKPNTYTYSKAIAETLIATKCSDIPTVMIRPSAVLSTISEPMPGWIDNWNGPTQLIYGTSNGIVRCVQGHPNFYLDLIPVDMVANLTIVAATQCERSKPLKIYNCCSVASNPIRIREFANITMDVFVKNEYNTIPYPYILYVKNSHLFKIMDFLFHTLPLSLADLSRIASGKKPRYKSYLNIIKSSFAVTNPFINNLWRFSDANTRKLLKSISDHDKETFNFDVKSIKWDEYLRDYGLGINDFLLKPRKRV